jgi:1-pyrroline-5-carboxylate dehydrogenase
MRNISIRKPKNEPVLNYRSDDAARDALRRAVEGIPGDFEVPLVINGEEIRTDEKIESVNPATGEVFCLAQKATPAHARAAVEAALVARETWGKLPVETRAQKFRDLEWLLWQRRYETMAVAAVECGFTPNEVAGSWAEMMDFVRFNPHWLLELAATAPGDGQAETNTLALRPLKGFTAAITPFNFPIAIGYNLPTVMALCGNGVVWKPASDAPMTSWMLMQAIRDAGFPPGVINMVTGSGREIMTPVLQHSGLNAVNFTGGVDTARLIAGSLYCAMAQRPHFPRFVAETGGKDFMVVDRDVDAWDAASCIVHGAFGRAGQKCSANSLVLVDRRTWPDLESAILTQLKSWRTADPTDALTDMGPVINRSAYDSITGYIERAKKDPAVTTLWGGDHSAEKGFWIQPTLFLVDADDHELLREEIFGPVAAVRLVADAEHALRIIRNHPYRLTGAAWSRDESWLDRWVPTLAEYAGNFYINRKTTGAIVDQQPFGGDGLSGTNYKAGGAWYLLQFLSQGSITRRHARALPDPGLWGWTRDTRPGSSLKPPPHHRP